MSYSAIYCLIVFILQGDTGGGVPVKELCDFSVDDLCSWLPLFLVEVRRRDGKEYRAKSLLEFLLCIQNVFDIKRGVKYSFLKDERFTVVRNSLDNVMRGLQRQGLGNNPKRADIITDTMEESLWREGVLGFEPSSRLLDTVVFILGFNLRPESK